jgi:hypothetical protein
MERQRLDVNIPRKLRQDLNDWVKEQNQTLTSVVTGYIEAGLARDRGELLEQESLPVLRELFRHELQQALVGLQRTIQEDLRKETLTEMRSLTTRSDKRLAALLLKVLREQLITRRLVYFLAEALVSGSDIQEVYTRAQAAAGKDLARHLEISPA